MKQVAEQNSSLNALVDKDVMKHGGCQLMLSPFVWMGLHCCANGEKSQKENSL